jgi:hypothetical protein
MAERKAVDVELRYERPWKLGIVWFVVILAMLGLAQALVSFLDLSHRHLLRLQLVCAGAGILANTLRAILEPRIAKKTAYLREEAGSASS